MKGFGSMLARSLVAARTKLVRITVELSNQLRGLMKTFGLIVPSGKGRNFEANVRRLLIDQIELSNILLPMLDAWHDIRMRAADLTKLLLAAARKSHACRLLMTIPGVGAITPTSFATAIEDPSNFKSSRAVGAWLGLTSRRYQSGKVDYSGRISRRGDRHLRGLLYEAALVILTRSPAESDLRSWGFKLRERLGFKRAAVALALHAMLKTGTAFNQAIDAEVTQ